MATDVVRAPTEGDELFTLQEAASYLKVSPATMRRRVRSKRVRHIRMDGVLRFWRSDLDAFLDEQTVSVEPTPVSEARLAATPTRRSQAAHKGRGGRAA